jgi:hypothetical protein
MSREVITSRNFWSGAAQTSTLLHVAILVGCLDREVTGNQPKGLRVSWSLIPCRLLRIGPFRSLRFLVRFYFRWIAAALAGIAESVHLLT